LIDQRGKLNKLLDGSVVFRAKAIATEAGINKKKSAGGQEGREHREWPVTNATRAPCGNAYFA
jgi:hypothetical protein